MEYRPQADLGGRRIALVASRFNQYVTERLLAGAHACLLEHGVPEESRDVYWVPGAFEIPLVAQRLAKCGRYATVVALGAVIRGETPHFDHVARVAADGTARASYESGVPVGFGILTTENLDQALARSGDGPSNKGYQATLSALEMADLLDHLP
jgi:6,7-dimethyl-8-ribityllumazine synthase